MRLAFSLSQPSPPGWLLLHGATISLWHSLASCPQMAAVKLPLQQLAPCLGPAVSARFLVPGLQNPESPRSEGKLGMQMSGRETPFLLRNFIVFYLSVLAALGREPQVSSMLRSNILSPLPTFYLKTGSCRVTWAGLKVTLQPRPALHLQLSCLSFLSPCNDRSTSPGLSS